MLCIFFDAKEKINEKNTLVMILLVAFSVTSCETLSKADKYTMIGGLTGCLTGF